MLGGKGLEAKGNSRGNRRRRFGAALLLGTALTTGVIVRQSAAPAAAETAQTRRFTIAPQSLASALRQFADQSGMQLAYRTADLKDVNSPGFTGSATGTQALTRLLAGTGFAYSATAVNTVTIQRPASTAGGTAPAGAIPLDTIDVQSDGVSGYNASRSSTGTKTNTPIIETPQSISVLTREELDVRNVQRERDAFRYTAGVFAEPYGADPRPLFDAPYIRGFAQSTTGIYRDGLREAYGIWAGFLSEYYGLERVSVLKGPASVLYGQTSPGGIVDMTTKRPPETPFHEIELQGGNFDRYQGAVDLGGPVGEDGKLFYRITGVYRDSGTQFEYGNGDRIAEDRRYLAPAITWRPNTDTKLTILASYLYNKTAAPFMVTLTPGQPTHLLTGDPNFSKSEAEQETIGYQFEHRFDNGWNFRQNFRYGRADLEYGVLNGLAVGTTYYRQSQLVKESLDSLMLDNQAEAKFGTGTISHTFLIGTDYQWVHYDSQTHIGSAPSLDLLNPVYGQAIPAPTTTSSSSTQTRDQVGLYAQDQMKIMEKWILTIGGRYDWATADTESRLTAITAHQDDSAASWRAGLTYLFDNGIAPYVSYTNSFLPTSGTDYSGNPFKPTTADQYEAGVKYQPIGFNGLFTASVYDLSQQNVLTPDTAHPTTSFRVQTGEVRSRGVEFEAKFSPMQGWNVIAAVTHQSVQVTKSNGTDLGKRPPWVANDLAGIWSDYTIQSGPFAGLGFGGGVHYVGSTFADAANTLKNTPYTLVDALLRYDFGMVHPELKGWHAALNVNNLFDKEVVVCTGALTCTFSSGRTIVGSLKYRW